MGFWNFIGTLFDLSRSASSSTSSKSNQSKSAASKSKTADSQQPFSTTAPPATPVDTFAKTKVKSPATRTEPIAPSVTDIEIGAYSTFSPISIDDAGICLRCTPEIPGGDDADLFIDLGIDFGTRYTKVCFRNSDSDQTSVVTFDNGSVNLEQALVPSQIAILDRGEILTGLTSNEWEASQWPITSTINFIKMRLAYLDLPQDNPHWPPPVDALDSPATIENLSAYFLGRLIARSRNWIQTTQPDLFKKRKVGWVLKVGAPVEYWRGPAIDRFEHVLKLSWALSFTPMVRGGDMVTLPQLNQCMNHVRTWVDQRDLNCFAKPEIAAAVWAHIRAVGSREGFFVFFDVGEGTTEGASFRFYRDNGENRISFYSGFVRPLGVATLLQQLQDELALDSKSVQDALLSWNPSSYNADQKNILKSQTRKYFQRIVARVIVIGFNRYRSARPYIWKSEIGSILKVFLGGGGSQISFFKHAVESTYTDFNHQRGIPDLPPYTTDNVPEPKKDLDLQNLGTSVFNRFSIAYGLSIAEGQFPEFDFPDDTDFPKPPPRPEPPNHPDMKDLC